MHPVNERYIEISRDEFPLKCAEYFAGRHFLRMMFAADERALDGHFKVYAVFSPSGEDRFEILTLKP